MNLLVPCYCFTEISLQCTWFISCHKSLLWRWQKLWPAQLNVQVSHLISSSQLKWAVFMIVKTARAIWQWLGKFHRWTGSHLVVLLGKMCFIVYTAVLWNVFVAATTWTLLKGTNAAKLNNSKLLACQTRAIFLLPLSPCTRFEVMF